MNGDRLIEWSSQPRNAETPAERLRRSWLTPTETFFVRNHGAVPAVDANEYRLTVGGHVRRPLVLSLCELRQRFNPVTVTATVTCAGNRRSQLNPVPGGIPWGAGAIGNARWTGVRLRDILSAAGIGPDGRHVAFTGRDQIDDAPFGGSIPVPKAVSPEVLLATDMNGSPLPAEHGYPVRVIVPGYIGARSVKWLTGVSVQPEPSMSHFQRNDYTVNGTSLTEFPLNSAVCQPLPGEVLPGQMMLVEGYAIGTGGRPIDRVDISADAGLVWHSATLHGPSRPWTWRFWYLKIDIEPGRHHLVARARDCSGASQPEHPSPMGNPRGYAHNAWHRLQVTSVPSNSGTGLPSPHSIVSAAHAANVDATLAGPRNVKPVENKHDQT
jgi:sulfite oxidase